MSEELKHECGVALVRLLKEPGFYRAKYGSSDYALAKMALLLEKQHNRGQDGAGAAGLYLNPQAGSEAWFIEKSVAANPLSALLEKLSRHIHREGKDAYGCVLGHLRYATFGKGDEKSCHPFLHESSTLERTLFLAGNFNLTDTEGIFGFLGKSGHHLSGRADGYLVTKLLAHFLGEALDRSSRGGGGAVDMRNLLEKTAMHLDGAFTMAGMTASGHVFAFRDAAGIRPGWYYADEEVFVVASERPAIQAAFDLPPDAIKEIPPGCAMMLSPEGNLSVERILPEAEKRSCVFERIYFSRGNDAEIHKERKALGCALARKILKMDGVSLEKAFFSYIPNSAQVCFHGMLEELIKVSAKSGEIVRFGQVAVKDAKFRTFIADAALRKDFYQHVYDVTYGLVREEEDTLVVVDDSIVRGNTMKRAILPMLDRLRPKRIIVASSAPPIKYPDCYGIDMASLGELVAFGALCDVLEAKNNLRILGECAIKAKKYLKESAHVNALEEAYGCVTEEELRQAITRRLVPEGMRAKVDVVFLGCDELMEAIPGYAGDWYFTGNYPTKGGYGFVNKALLRFMEGDNSRAY